MEIAAVLKPGSKGADEQPAHKAPDATAIEIAQGERQAKTPGPAGRAVTSQPARAGITSSAFCSQFLESDMRLSLFDGFVLHKDEQHMTLPPQAQRLIAFVTLRRTVRRDEVRCALWPDISDDRAGARLRTTLWRLREQGRGVLRTANGQLSLAENIDVDVRNWMALAFEIIDQPGSVATVDLGSLRQCGDLLPGWYDDWVLLERERARQLQLHVLEIVADELIGLGRLAAALEFATRALQMEQLRESAHRLVIRVHLAEGNVCEARRQFESCRQILRDELGIHPSDQVRDLIGGQYSGRRS